MNQESLDVEGCLLKPGGVIGDENERAESELATHNQPQLETMLIKIEENATLPEVAKTLRPKVGANCRGSMSDSKYRG